MPQRRAKRLYNRTWAPRSYGGKLPPSVTKGAEVVAPTRAGVAPDPRVAISMRGDEFTDWRKRTNDYAIAALADELDETRITFADHFMGDSLNALWTTTAVSGGSTEILDGQLGGVLRLVSPLIVNASILVDFGNIRQIDKTRNPTVRARVKAVDTVQIVVRIGLYNASLTQDFIWIENDPGASAVNWFGKIDSAGTGSNVNMGTGLDTANWQLLELKVNNTEGAVDFFIDNELKGSLGTNLPTTTLQPILYLKSKTSTGADDNYFLLDSVKFGLDEAA